MTKRMQVLLDEAEFTSMRAAARTSGMTLAEWVRRHLRQALRSTPSGDRQRKLAAVRAASAHSFPTADVDQMLEEIESGYRASR